MKSACIKSVPDAMDFVEVYGSGKDIFVHISVSSKRS